MQRSGVAAADLEFDGLHVDVHAVVDADDGAMDDGTILELDGDGLAAQLDQELDELHGYGGAVGGLPGTTGWGRSML